MLSAALYSFSVSAAWKRLKLFSRLRILEDIANNVMSHSSGGRHSDQAPASVGAVFSCERYLFQQLWEGGGGGLCPCTHVQEQSFPLVARFSGLIYGDGSSNTQPSSCTFAHIGYVRAEGGIAWRAAPIIVPRRDGAVSCTALADGKNIVILLVLRCEEFGGNTLVFSIIQNHAVFFRMRSRAMASWETLLATASQAAVVAFPHHICSLAAVVAEGRQELIPDKLACWATRL